MIILITTFNRTEQLALLLRSIDAQKEEIESILVVLRKTDEKTRIFLESCVLLNQKLKISLIEEPGAVKALAEGIKLCYGKDVLILDDDILLPADYLTKLRNYSNLQPTWIIAGTNFVVHNMLNSLEEIDSQIQKLFEIRHLFSKSKKFIGKIRWFGKFHGNFEFPIHSPPHVGDHFQGCNVYIPKIDSLPDKYFTGDSVFYEIEWSIRMRTSGRNILVVPELAVLHVQPENQSRITNRKNNSLKMILQNSRNLSYALNLHVTPTKKIIQTLWFFFIGQKPVFGLLRYCYFFFREPKKSINDFFIFFPSILGWFLGLIDTYRSKIVISGINND